MNFHELVRHLIDDTLGSSLPAFRPELVLCATIVVLLLARMFCPKWQSGAFYLMLIGSTAALYLAAPWELVGREGPPGPQSIFTGMLVFDAFSVYMRSLLLLFLVLFTTFTQVAGVPNREDATEFYVLVLGAMVGMCLMVSANHMLIVFLGIEMASVPSYVLAGMLKHRRQSSEAALKYAVFGAGAAGVMLYGISLLVGTLGSAHLPTMAARLAEMEPTGNLATVLMLGGMMLMVGLAFKLSAVPCHFWAPDVFEGATAEVAAFLSIASKAAALGLLTRLAIQFAAVGPEAQQYVCGLIAVLAAVTCTFGNLAAYAQTNVKRLLAYSTIAHAGYMMMAVAAVVAMTGVNPAGGQKAVAALAFYLAIYLFMNLGAFAAVAFLRNVLRSEEIADYAGLIRRSPGLVVCFSLVLFSLVGLPPLAGFAAEFTIFAALVDAHLITLLVVGGLNTALSLFYYLRVVKVMILESEPEDGPVAEIPLASVPGVYCAVLALPILLLGVWWAGLFDWAEQAALAFFLR